ncbi:hypothetical protein Tco_0743193 [Tanacetum coccineum]
MRNDLRTRRPSPPVKQSKEEMIKGGKQSEHPEQNSNGFVSTPHEKTKPAREDEIVRDIEETFKTLRKINMKLNPKKCTFGVEEGMFLGYQVNTKGIRICPDKVDAVLSLQSPKCLKDVHKRKSEAAFKQMKEHIAKLPNCSLLQEQEATHCLQHIPKEAAKSICERASISRFYCRKPEDEGHDNSAKEEEPLPARGTFVSHEDNHLAVDECEQE